MNKRGGHVIPGSSFLRSFIGSMSLAVLAFSGLLIIAWEDNEIAAQQEMHR